MRSSDTTIQSPFDVELLRQNFRGQVIGPHDDAYEDAREVWNGSIDRRPLVIARCTGTPDIVEALRLARAHHLLVAVRGGGHNVAGNAVCDGGIVIDLSGMKGIWIDPVRKLARVQPGVTWAEFDREAQGFGLATPGGLVSMTGVAGFTLGGGLGWLSSRFGAASDNLVSVDLVTAEGRNLRASASENADLFWGLRGGGGNFGIATSFEFSMHEVGPQILGGLRFYTAEQGRRIIQILREQQPSTPDELFCAAVVKLAPPAPFLPREVHGRCIVILGVFWTGGHQQGWEALRPLDEAGIPLADLVAVRPYTQMQSLLDAGWPAGFQNYWKAQYLGELPDKAIDVILGRTAEITSGLSDVKVIPLGGAFSRVDEGETALGHRSAPWIININSRWSDPEESDRHIHWTRELWQAVQPYSTGGVYVNFLGDEGEDRVRDAYGPDKYRRLVALKDKYDPGNVFRLNQNIRPTHSRQ